MFNLDQCHALLVAERSRDVVPISEAMSTVLAASPKLTLLDIEQVFRESGSPIYLIAKPELR